MLALDTASLLLRDDAKVIPVLGAVGEPLLIVINVVLERRHAASLRLGGDATRFGVGKGL
jgi:hypothetical protein